MEEIFNMAQTIRLKRGNKANLPLLAVGEPAICLDTKELFIGTSSGNQRFGDAVIFSNGVPETSPADDKGKFSYDEVNKDLYVAVGDVWKKVTVKTIDELTDGTTYGRVKKTDITNGSVNKVSDGTNTKTAAEIKTHIDAAAPHRIINDDSIAAHELWSSQKIKNEIELAKKGVEYQDSVKDKDLVTPPTTPTAKDRYIVKATATGAWVGKDTQIAEWDGAKWLFYTPVIGTTVYVDDEQKQYSWNGTAWVISGGAPQTINAGAGLTGGGQADTVTINIGAGSGITVAADSISVKGGKGLVIDANGVAANIDGSSIIYGTSDKLTIGVVDGGTF